MSLRNLRACLVCSYIQTGSKFNQTGCPNCEEFLEMRGNADAVQDCTSTVFEGMITLNYPPSENSRTPPSWVAKWQRIDQCQPGLYAVKVEGVLPEDYIAAAEEHGVTYQPRDGSAEDEEQ